MAQKEIARLVSVDDGRVSPDDYTSSEFLALENSMVWPRVWHFACREEDLPQAGSYTVYDFLNESILLTRDAAGAIRAYHNVCRHRGRQLMEGSGCTNFFRCRYHGWRWNIDGSILEVLSRDDWRGCLSDSELRLREVHCGTWEGFVFINLASDPEPLDEYLDPVPMMFGHYAYGKMRYESFRTIRLDCNWKVALEAFNEAYHVAGTHPQLLSYFDDLTVTKTFGKHGMVTAARDTGGIRPMGVRSDRLNEDKGNDARQNLVDFFKHMSVEFGGTYQPRDAEAAHRLLSELPEDATPFEVIAKFLEVRKEASEAVGAGWPEVSIGQLREGGLIWHVFPNTVINPTFNAAVVYRSRPHSTDPNQCEMDIIMLRRFGPNAEPSVSKQYYKDWQDAPQLGLIMTQDFGNLSMVQKGLRSSGFEATRPNPIQESTVLNFHDVLRQYIDV